MHEIRWISITGHGISLAISPFAMGLFRKRYRVLLFALLVAALVVPVGFALSVESEPASAPRPVVATTVTTVSTFPSVSGSTKLFLVGAALFGLAAAVRRTI